MVTIMATTKNKLTCDRCGGNHREYCHSIQNYGEQHSDFHSAEMKRFRREDRRTVEALKDTLTRMNWHMGRGNLYAFVFDTNRKGGTVSRSFQYGSDTRNFSIDGDEIRFLGKTRKIGYKVR
jgi:hypothetical protein